MNFLLEPSLQFTKGLKKPYYHDSCVLSSKKNRIAASTYYYDHLLESYFSPLFIE